MKRKKRPIGQLLLVFLLSFLLVFGSSLSAFAEFENDDVSSTTIESSQEPSDEVDEPSGGVEEAGEEVDEEVDEEAGEEVDEEVDEMLELDMMASAMMIQVAAVPSENIGFSVDTNITKPLLVGENYNITINVKNEGNDYERRIKNPVLKLYVEGQSEPITRNLSQIDLNKGQTRSIAINNISVPSIGDNVQVTAELTGTLEYNDKWLIFNDWKTITSDFQRDSQYNYTAVSTTTVVFQVTDGIVPISGAKVIINDKQITTNSSGMASINVKSDNYTYKVTAKNFIEETGTVEAVGNQVTVPVEMIAEVLDTSEDYLKLTLTGIKAVDDDVWQPVSNALTLVTGKEYVVKYKLENTYKSIGYVKIVDIFLNVNEGGASIYSKGIKDLDSRSGSGRTSVVEGQYTFTASAGDRNTVNNTATGRRKVLFWLDQKSEISFWYKGVSPNPTDPVYVDNKDIPNCDNSFKIDGINGQEFDGTYQAFYGETNRKGFTAPNGKIVNGSITISNSTRYEFDWSASSNIRVTRVIVKAGNGAYIYDYPNYVSGGSGLYSPRNQNNMGNQADISHVVFCYEVIPDNPAIQLSKTVDTEIASPGDEVTYNFVITNIGNVSLQNITLVDELLELDHNFEGLTLIPGASHEYEHSFIIPEDFQGETLVNLAVVTANYMETIVDDDDDVSIEIINNDDPTGTLTVVKRLLDYDESEIEDDDTPFTVKISGPANAELEDEYSFSVNVPLVLNNLPLGEYYIEEVEVPEGFINLFLDESEKRVTLSEENPTATVIVSNMKVETKGNIIIKKVIQDGTEEDDDVEFIVWVNPIEREVSITAGNEEGELLEGLDPGTYYIWEDLEDEDYELVNISSDAGFLSYEEGELEIELEAGQTIIVTVTNKKVTNGGGPGGPGEEKTGTITFQKSIVDGSEEDETVEFAVWVFGTDEFERKVTFTASEPRSIVLPVGNYTFAEEEIEGYETIDISPSFVQLGDGDEVTVTVTNRKLTEDLTGTIIFRKVLENGTQEDNAVDFVIWFTAIETEIPFGVGRDGIVEGLEAREYWFEEVEMEGFEFVSFSIGDQILETIEGEATVVLEEGQVLIVTVTNRKIVDDDPTTPPGGGDDDDDDDDTPPTTPGGGGGGGGTTTTPPATIELEDEEIPLGTVEIEIEDEEIPLGTVEFNPEDDEEIIIIEEEVPLGIPQLPKTGESNPYSFYLLGLLLTVIGIRMRKVF